MLDEEIEIKVAEEIFTVRMVEERSGGSDLCGCRMGGSRGGIANSEEGSMAIPKRANSVLGV
ncbi:hypothetical protein A2U01_0065262, partial [Trifolium medium]|nr:hypothetical protein [Trifolium medium]